MTDLKQKRFLNEIQIAQGIGITLVVIGHLLANATQGPQWYADVKRLIYQFHMPFFMYLSGFAFMWVREGKIGMPGSKFVSGRAVRLLVPFFIFGFLIVVAKQVAQHFVQVDNLPDSWIDGFSTLFVNTESSPARSIWYLFVLFVMSCATFALGYLRNRGLLLLAAVALVMNQLDVPDILYLNRVFYFYIFFVLGMLAAANYDTLISLFDKGGWLFVAAFAGVLALLWMHGRISDESKLLGGVSSLLAIHYLALRARGQTASLFAWLGALSMPIYLMNTLAIGGFKAAYVIVFSDVNNMFWLYLAGAMLAGTVLPILAYYGSRPFLPRLAGA